MTYSDFSQTQPHSPRSAGRRGERGASLIEVLVSMFVLAVGLLGFAGMQMVGIKSNHSAQVRSQATLLAYDLADRMRGARDAALDGDYDDDGNSEDRRDWDDELVRRLGAGATAKVTRNEANITIAITWNDQRGDIRAAPAADDGSEDDTDTPGPDADPGIAMAQGDIAPDEPASDGEQAETDDETTEPGHVIFAYSTEI